MQIFYADGIFEFLQEREAWHSIDGTNIQFALFINKAANRLPGMFLILKLFKSSSMKILLPAILITIACNRSTEDRILKAITDIEKSAFEKEGHHLESIKIDSIDYDLINENQYYRTIQLEIDTRATQLTTDMIASLSCTNSDSARLRVKAEIDDQLSYQKIFCDKLDSLIKYSDTAVKIYRVTYYSMAKTDKGIFNISKKKYLSVTDLKELKTSF